MEREKTSRGINKAMEVEPFKKVKDIEKIKQYLKGKESKRDYMLFVVGINVGLRAGDLLSLKIKNVFNEGDVVNQVIIYEEKTDKKREFTLNASAKEAIKTYLDTLKEIDPEEYLFKSRKGEGHLQVEAAHRIIKTVASELNIKGNYGTHSLRKTFAYHTYTNNISTNPGILETLQRILNHSSSAVTLRYIGITKEVITDIYNNLNL
jgi:integrase